MGSKTRTKRRKTKGANVSERYAKVGASLAAAAIVAACGAWWLFGRGTGCAPGNGAEEPEIAPPPAVQTAAPQQTAEEEPATPPQENDAPNGEEEVPAVPPASASAPSDAGNVGWPPYPLPAGYVKSPGQMALPDGRILTFRPPAEGTMVKVHSFGKTFECDSEGGWREITKKPIFDNPIENQLVSLAIPGGVFVPAAILGNSPEELDDILHRDVVINPDDDESTVEKKEAVAALKRQILEYMDEGGTFEGFVEEMRSYSKEEKKLRNSGMNRLEDIMESGDIDEARDFLQVYNGILEEQGFAPLRLPKKWREQLGM